MRLVLLVTPPRQASFALLGLLARARQSPWQRAARVLSSGRSHWPRGTEEGGWPAAGLCRPSRGNGGLPREFQRVCRVIFFWEISGFVT